MSNEKKELVLVIEYETPHVRRYNSGGQYCHVRGIVRTVGKTLPSVELEGIYWGTGYEREDQIAMGDFQVFSQGNWQDGLEGDLYSWDSGLSYSFRGGEQLGLNDLEIRAKFLRSLHRKLDKIKAADGWPRDFAQFVLRVAKSLKIKRIAFRNSPEQLDITGDSFKLVSLEDADFRIRRQIEAWQQQYLNAHPPQTVAEDRAAG